MHKSLRAESAVFARFHYMEVISWFGEKFTHVTIVTAENINKTVQLFIPSTPPLGLLSYRYPVHTYTLITL